MTRPGAAVYPVDSKPERRNVRILTFSLAALTALVPLDYRSLLHRRMIGMVEFRRRATQQKTLNSSVAVPGESLSAAEREEALKKLRSLGYVN
ncbi:hypothetical protein COW53_00825 [bacterium CG17_big_fil_post_rev_8_21_14_2_50_64_8]|nr:MAG: hypothetical protein COW53_00825 [bacterium CG17_big_fil_post_rev_8_21_14_2_50_64_8]